MVKATRAKLAEGTVWSWFLREQCDDTLPIALLWLVVPVLHLLTRSTADTFPTVLIVKGGTPSPTPVGKKKMGE